MESLRDIHIPVLAEAFPGLLRQRAHPRGGAGAEHQRPRPVSLDDAVGGGGLGDVGDPRGEALPDFVARLVQIGAGARDADNRGADGALRAHSIQVFAAGADGIAAITVFLDPRLFGAFGLPPTR